MAVFGWICMLLMLSVVTFGIILAALNTLGKYNIGGVPNSVTQKLTTLGCIGFVLLAWALLFHYAPFSVTLT